MTRKTFILSGAGQVVTARGRRATFDSLDRARAERGRALVGAVSFDPETPDRLWEPETIEIAPDCSVPATPGAREGHGVPSGMCLTGSSPALDEHHYRICEVISRIRGGGAQKVVIGRSEYLGCSQAVEPEAVFARFRDSDPSGNAYLVDLGPQILIGSSPELLIARSGRRISAFPLAGTCPRAAGQDDIRNAEKLLESTKDREEHAYVTAALRAALAPLCDELSIPSEPELVPTPTTWHLGTPIAGSLRDPQTTILDLVAVTHPTPAVCGTPPAAALEIIREIEGHGARDYFGGAFGYCTACGDGEFRVTIRGIALDADRRSARAWAGGGLTAESIPDVELHETVVKLARARQAMEVLA